MTEDDLLWLMRQAFYKGATFGLDRGASKANAQAIKDRAEEACKTVRRLMGPSL